MFACALYPRDAAFLALVEEEVLYQTRRLQVPSEAFFWHVTRARARRVRRVGSFGPSYSWVGLGWHLGLHTVGEWIGLMDWVTGRPLLAVCFARQSLVR